MRVNCGDLGYFELEKIMDYDSAPGFMYVLHETIGSGSRHMGALFRWHGKTNSYDNDTSTLRTIFMTGWDEDDFWDYVRSKGYGSGIRWHIWRIK